MGPQQRRASRSCPGEQVLHRDTGQELWARAAEEFRVCAAGLEFTRLIKHLFQNSSRMKTNEKFSTNCAG